MKKLLFGLIALFIFGAMISSAEVATYWTPADIGGGLYGSATATITTGAGYVDVSIQNTSSRGQIGDDWATPYITELEFTFPDGLVVDADASQVISEAGSYFAQGADTPVLESTSTQVLNYNLVDRDDPKGLMKKCLMSYYDIENNRNDNSLGSMNVLDASLIPQEDLAVGFLNPNPDTYSGAVFDTITYHIEFTDETYQVDESFYADADTLVIKYQGGGDYSYHAYNIPEPATLSLLGLFAGGLWVIRRFFPVV